ncbi:MAG: hypothetical protein ACJ74O_03260 [Frankiaceae bacterium]
MSDEASGAVGLTPELIARMTVAMHAALAPLTGADWSVPAHELDWSCRATAVHIADSHFAHAARIVAQPTEWFVPAEVTVEERAGPDGLLQVIDACAELLRGAAVIAEPGSTAWHPWGPSDVGGSIAMAVAEGLLHAWDITSALGSDWRPPGELCRPVLARVLPDAPPGDPADALLWSTGRIALPGRPRRQKWRYYGEVRD